MYFLFVFLLLSLGLTVGLWVGTLFFQGYIYTEPSPELYWQAPASGVGLALFFTFWIWLVQSTASPGELPYDTFFRFSPMVEKYKEPAKRLWAVKEEVKDPIQYKRRRTGPMSIEYRDDFDKPYSPLRVKAILIEEENGDKLRLEPRPAPVGSPYREFVDKTGWSMTEYETGPTGQLVAFRYGRLFGNLVLNFVHFLLWFLLLWLVLRFTWGHALGFAIVLWLLITLTVLPMVLSASVPASQEAGGRRTAELALP